MLAADCIQVLKLNYKCTCLFIIFCNIYFITPASAQEVACNTITSQMNYTVSAVTIVGRWVPSSLQDTVLKLVGVGQLFDPAKVGLAEELVRTEIKKNETDFASKLIESTSVLFITSDICPIPDSQGLKKVRITIHPYYIRIDLLSIGNNILPIPRTIKPTFYKQVPSFLLAASPFVGFMNDRRFGFSAIAQTSTNLLAATGKATSSPAANKNQLDLSLNFRKSFNYSYYNISGLLQFVHPVFSNKAPGYTAGLMYSGNLQPISGNNYSNSTAKIFGSIYGNCNISFINKYSLSSAVEFSNNHYYFQNNKLVTPETDYSVSALCDGIVAKGFTRLGLWFNAGSPKKDLSLHSYQQFAGWLGYAKSLGNGHNSIDIESILNFGYTWGTPPTYHEYFAGNSSSNFLYLPLSASNTMSFPQGPIIRSLGEKEGSLSSAVNSSAGGNSYWGIHTSFAIPVKGWAYPLIPDVVISEEPRRITIRSALKAQVNSAESFISNDLELNGGLSSDEADARAKEIADRDIRPTIYYLADRANLYSIKPLLYFDIGQLNNRNIDKRFWSALGMGLKLNIVNARLEFSYVQTLLPKDDASKGNFLMRFSIQNMY